jgi:uncharacterized membrane protein HdeD (DUF308 family)
MNNMVEANLEALAPRWWTFVVRGLVAILFGVLTFAMPGISLLTLVLLWGAYAFADGVFELTMAARAGRAGHRWGWVTLEGIVSLAAGVLAFLWPGMTAFVLLIVIAVRAVINGVAAIGTAIWLRREIRGEWLLGLSGVLSIAFGVLLFMSPGAGALALLWVIGAYAMVFGALLIGLGLRLHRFAGGGEHHFPTGGTPRPA